MPLSRDRKFFPTKPGARKITRRDFAPFVPETGPFRRVSIIEFLDPEANPRLRRQIERFASAKTQMVKQFLKWARHHVDHTRWWPTRRKIAHLYLDQVEEHGVRHEIDVAIIAETLGVTPSAVYKQLQNLREEGFLQRYREHYIDWEQTNAMRDALVGVVDNPEAIFICARSVHEPGPSFPRSGYELDTLPPDLKEGSSMYPTTPLTWKDSPDG